MQALARLPMEQRRRDLRAGLNTAGFITGYRGSPVGGLDKSLWQSGELLKTHHLHFQPAVNEDLGATTVWGTQQTSLFQGSRYDGVFSMWYGKGPGVDRSGDALRHANFAGTNPHGGVIMAVGDDPICHSSTIPQQSEFALQAADIPVLHPANVQEIYDFGLLAWALSRYSGFWVALKLLTDVAESSGTIGVGDEHGAFVLPTDFEMPQGGPHLRWPDWATDMDLRMEQVRFPALRAFVRANAFDKAPLSPGRKRLAIVTAGKSYGDTRQALADMEIADAQALDLGIGIYKPGLIWPLETEGLLDFVEGFEEVLVIEEGRPFLEPQIKAALYDLPEPRRPRISGKRDGNGETQFRSSGELKPADITRVLGPRLTRLADLPGVTRRLKLLEEISNRGPGPGAQFPRTPHFCSGCPHNTSTKVPEGSSAMAGIGCHFMAVFMDRNTHTYTHMGAEGCTWAGLAPFSKTGHMFVNIGDGTFYHSGSLAIRQAVAAKAPITYKILYNDAVAMTGGQPVDGPISVQQIAWQMEAEAIKRIALVSDNPDKFNPAEFPSRLTIHHRRDLDAVQRELREYKDVSVLIYEQTCGTEKRRRRKRGKLEDPAKRVFINDRVCEGCGDCGVASNCLSVLPKETEFGRKRTIDQSACNKDYSCVNGFCPSFVTVHGGGLRKRSGSGADFDETLFANLPEPQLPDTSKAYAMLVGGIGGTGVVTVDALLGTAAHMEGKAVRSLDDTGLAQKFGAVYGNLQIADTPEALNVARLGAGHADLILGPDLVTSAGPKVLSLIEPGRTRALINTYEQMTGAFTRNPDLRIPSDSLRHGIADLCGAERTEFVDATRLALGLMGDAIGANTFLLGFAYQRGLIPISSQALEKAIELNGTAVQANLRVFRWGRLAAHDRAAVDKVLGDKAKTAEAPAPQSLEEIIARREADLTDYQNAGYAKRYRQLVDRVAAAEKTRAPGKQGLAEAVARYYYKLLAYKDE
ncbi:MAG TPA: indolepyruvate ferredoxin oxidoreductase family protein, partial [Gammaproteobacteria bacterium]|nr:indolepyruvate ferredoxin oxidoreductase family protein [Gammaproteobacteria bacterium]MCH79054.1 indolepyruvate ferredoxin oxidoreductase family protein [Gammaproteobacteria bacterium]